MDAEKVNGSTKSSSADRAHMMAAHLGVEFTPEERQVLVSLHNRYQQGLEQFSERELAGLRFLRWRYDNGQFDI